MSDFAEDDLLEAPKKTATSIKNRHESWPTTEILAFKIGRRLVSTVFHKSLYVGRFPMSIGQFRWTRRNDLGTWV